MAVTCTGDVVRGKGMEPLPTWGPREDIVKINTLNSPLLILCIGFTQVGGASRPNSSVEANHEGQTPDSHKRIEKVGEA